MMGVECDLRDPCDPLGRTPCHEELAVVGKWVLARGRAAEGGPPASTGTGQGLRRALSKSAHLVSDTQRLLYSTLTFTLRRRRGRSCSGAGGAGDVGEGGRMPSGTGKSFKSQ